MVQVTVQMPMMMMTMMEEMGTMPTFFQPEIRRVSGGFEIDFGGPGIRFEMLQEE